MLEKRRAVSEGAILVHIRFFDLNQSSDLIEFSQLACSAGAQILAKLTGSKRCPTSKFLIGQGKLDELKILVSQHQADLILFNHALTPTQARNLEKVLSCRVVDRTGLILDIFAQRARTAEGKLQVELAQLKHLSTRLIRGWTHLERQKGGIGLRGPGETQLESDRRMIRTRIQSISKRLEKVKSQRALGRYARKKAQIPTVVLVGYTNSGKSTLFNKMTHSDVLSKDQVFATLDPTFRRCRLPLGDVILVDTVGFIRDLPHHLVEAFQATLEETRQAALLLQVIDVTDPQKQVHQRQVEKVLKQIGALEVPRIAVYNKVDCLVESLNLRARRVVDSQQVWVSAQTGQGLDDLKVLLGASLFKKETVGMLC